MLRLMCVIVLYTTSSVTVLIYIYICLRRIELINVRSLFLTLSPFFYLSWTLYARTCTRTKMVRIETLIGSCERWLHWLLYLICKFFAIFSFERNMFMIHSDSINGDSNLSLFLFLFFGKWTSRSECCVTTQAILTQTLRYFEDDQKSRCVLFVRASCIQPRFHKYTYSKSTLCCVTAVSFPISDLTVSSNVDSPENLLHAC